jgi:hypothetical protein
VERVALMRESLARLERAEAEAGGTEERRNIMTTRANFFALWGFFRESYMEYRRADQTLTLDATTHKKAAWVETLLDDPTRRLTAADSAAGGLSPPR